jgi:hypothetical protein
MSICQVCHRECATARVTLMQNIGFLIARQSKNFTAELCRECGLRMAKEMTLITAFLGWWGVISFFFTPIILITNIVAISKLRALPPPDAPWSGPPSIGGGGAGAGGAGPNVAGDAQQYPPRMQKSRAAKSADASLLVGIFGLIFFCVPLVSAAGLYMGLKSRRQAAEDNEAMPKSAFAGLVMSAIGLVLFLGCAAIAAAGYRESSARLEALHAKADKGRTVATLDSEEACALVEERLAEDMFQGKRMKSVTCKGPLAANDEKGELDGITAELDEGSAGLTACLRKADRWFVAALEPCSQLPLGAKQAGLTPEKQEAAWRQAEKDALAGERIDAVTKQLDKVRGAILDDGRAVPACSKDIALGRTIPPKLAQLGGDASYRYVGSNESVLAAVDLQLLDGKAEKGWEFLSTKDVLGFLDEKASKTDRGTSAKELQRQRYLIVADSLLEHELPEVPAKSPGAAYEGGAFVGLMYLADLRSGEVLCTSPLTFENSEHISVTTYHGHASDSTVLTEAKKDFAKQYSAAVEAAVATSLKRAPMTAELEDGDEVDDAPVKPAVAKKPAPAPKKKPAKAP